MRLGHSQAAGLELRRVRGVYLKLPNFLCQVLVPLCCSVAAMVKQIACTKLCQNGWDKVILWGARAGVWHLQQARKGRCWEAGSLGEDVEGALIYSLSSPDLFRYAPWTSLSDFLESPWVRWGWKVWFFGCLDLNCRSTRRRSLSSPRSSSALWLIASCLRTGMMPCLRPRICSTGGFFFLDWFDWFCAILIDSGLHVIQWRRHKMRAQTCTLLCAGYPRGQGQGNPPPLSGEEAWVGNAGCHVVY